MEPMKQPKKSPTKSPIAQRKLISPKGSRLVTIEDCENQMRQTADCMPTYLLPNPLFDSPSRKYKQLPMRSE